MSVTECDVTNVPASVDCDPYPVVVPYETCELEAWSVVHVIVAEVVVTPLAATALITGAGAAVVNVKVVEVVVEFVPLVDNTSKSYAVDGVNPVSVTECDVTRVPSSVDCDPYAVVVP